MRTGDMTTEEGRNLKRRNPRSGTRRHFYELRVRYTKAFRSTVSENKTSNLPEDLTGDDPEINNDKKT